MKAAALQEISGNVSVLPEVSAIEKSQGFASFDLAATLECGQCFRWEALPGGEYRFAAGSRFMRAGPSSLSSLWEDEGWRVYFDLDRDYDAIRRELSILDPALEKAAAYAPGIRILNQDPWEALCCFILSQNNNIPRIKGIVARLCENFGESVEGGFDFPGPEKLASLSPEELSPLRCGFRARYLIDAAQRVALKKEGLVLGKLREIPVEEARTALMKIVGVGHKVADCTLLYGLHRLEVFPIDVWMKRAMERLFPGKSPEMFGPWAGVAQQYIFHYSRNHPWEFR